MQNVTDGLIESTSTIGVFYVFPELDGLLAVLFLKVLCLKRRIHEKNTFFLD